METGNGERGTGNGERETGNGERGTENGKRETGNGKREASGHQYYPLIRQIRLLLVLQEQPRDGHDVLLAIGPDPLQVMLLPVNAGYVGSTDIVLRRRYVKDGSQQFQRF